MTPTKTRLSIDLAPEMHRDLQEMAAENVRSISAEVRLALAERIERYRREQS